jgi:hypothetical protein
MILLLCAAVLVTSEYLFVNSDHEVTMRVDYLEPYRGQPLEFYEASEPSKRRCYTGRCIEHFHGAAALVHFEVRRRHANAARPASLREVATIIDQSRDLPAAPPFGSTQDLVNGRASDLQVLGYDEAGIPEEERERLREQAPVRMWRRCGQELFLNGSAKPFLVLEWRHTTKGIELVRVTPGTGWKRKADRRNDSLNQRDPVDHGAQTGTANFY